MVKIITLIIQLIKITNLILNIKIKKKNNNFEEKIKKVIEEMGPVFIKFAQMVSLRTDILSHDITKELEKLQTHANNINYSLIHEKIKKIDKNIYNNIDKINENALASASIAQIHTALLKNKKKIIIKILKPDIKNDIKRDINILYYIAKIITFCSNKFNRLKLIDLVDELKNTLDNEINLNNEYINVLKFKKNVKELANIYIPNVILNQKNDDILIMEYVDGINITNEKKLKKNAINKDKLIKILLELFYKQVFEHDIFHADLHPGNILISKTNLNKTIVILLDFGIIGKLKNEEKIYLSENMIAFAKKDYKKIINLHIKAKTLKIKTNIEKEEMEKEIKNIFDPISGKYLKDIDFRHTLNSLAKFTKKFNMQLQPNLILFQKTLFTIEGLCRNLNEQVNLWKITRETIEKIIIEQILKIKKIKNSENNENIYHKNTKIQYNKIFSNISFFFIIIYILLFLILDLSLNYYIKTLSFI